VQLYTQIVATFHVMGLRVHDRLDEAKTTLATARRDRGSVSTEQVLIAIGLIAFAAAAIAGIRAYLNKQIANIK
jgi:hypothetical protein